jgi:hypothetical protein
VLTNSGLDGSQTAVELFPAHYIDDPFDGMVKKKFVEGM